MKKINLIALVAIVSVVSGALSPLAYATENTTATNETIASNVNLEDSLVQLRKDKADFNTSKQQEETEQAASLKEKVAAKRQAAQARAEAARKTKDEKRKIVLTRLLDIQIKQLGNVKERVAKMPNIKLEQITQLNTSIDTAVAVLTAKKAEVTAASSPEQLKKLAKDIKDLFKSKRDIVKQIVTAILASRADNTITAAEGRLAEIKAKIAALKTAGQDTTALDSLLTIAEGKIATANTKAGKEDLKGAISDLKEAYKNMKSVVEKTDIAE